MRLVFRGVRHGESGAIDGFEGSTSQEGCRCNQETDGAGAILERLSHDGGWNALASLDIGAVALVEVEDVME